MRVYNLPTCPDAPSCSGGFMRVRLFRSLLVLMAIAAFASSAFPRPIPSQTKLARGNIWGKVLGKDQGEPLPGVVVIAFHTPTNQIFSSQPTDNQGNYLFGNIPAGVYSFSLAYQGTEYAVQEQVDGRSDVDFVLRPSFRLVGEKAFLIKEDPEPEPPAPVVRETVDEQPVERGASEAPSIPSSGESSALSQASALLQSKSYSEAASAFREYFRAAHTDKFTVALALYCDQGNLTRAVENSGDSAQLFILSNESQPGRSCYGVFWGVFDSHSAAEQAIGGLPTAMRRPDSRPIPISRLIYGKASTAIDTLELKIVAEDELLYVSRSRGFSLDARPQE